MQSARRAIGAFIAACRKFSGPGPEDPGPFSFASERRVHRILADAGFRSVKLEPHDFDLDIACGGGIEEALEAAMALGPTSRSYLINIPGLDEIKHGDKFTITVDRAPDGKIKVTSLSWDEPAMKSGVSEHRRSSHERV